MCSKADDPSQHGSDDTLRAALERIAWYPCQAGAWAGETDPPRDRCLDPDYIEVDPGLLCHPCEAAAAPAASATDEPSDD